MDSAAGPNTTPRGLSVSDPLVETRDGTLRGSSGGRTERWLGVRYAQAPTGDRRWRAPVPVESWAGVRDARALPPIAPQLRMKAVDMGERAMTDEDCLFVNVWRPAAAGEPGAAPRAVMVWVHGGAYVIGGTSEPIYDGAALAERGDLIVVSLGYRLGGLGFLELSTLEGAEQAFDSNLAMRDVLCALEWVQTNIGAFGGDPERVTVFGESAGAGIVSTLLATPSARGLLSAAIVESSPATSMYGLARAKIVAERFVAKLGIDDAAALRALPVSSIIETSAELFAEIPTEFPGTLAFAPVVDGDLVPEHPVTVLSEGRGLPVPLIIGTNRDEATFFKASNSPLLPVGEQALTTMITSIAAENPTVEMPDREHILEAYEGVRQRLVGLGVVRDVAFRMPTVWIAEGHSRIAPTFLYRFDFSTPLLRVLRLGATHASELSLVWGNLDTDPRGLAYKLGGRRQAGEVSDRMLALWTSFAREGRPTDGGLPGAVPWPAFGAARSTLVIDHADRVVDDLDADLRTAWGDRAFSLS
ncbi:MULTISPECIES: carboxylesterase/lipase family protein [unclassified Pseudoclavibacter]|uniref:carboxylesterase/lipase family protein n=1 Tax=unclassified Pseudoclavibacter TaxID=2615177 RepID=UPI000CE862E7|nr:MULTISPECIES: carboxylesterase/lipase family protein [unclassified Pseudoclavibacter]PPF77724.1 carboxylesterase [Pseudoclavibacter sp. Z016]PPG05152.1 carboxylesterase [Pseudoclavibacter sp. RFBI5]